ncbi:hypothetical protein LTS10_005003 [Elasticomyces elasticus]|nr:hypothetical protein LTS10_005003 [Elasticomyces elasticus]
MISSKLPRAATRAVTITPTVPATCTALSRPTGHQRRASSSKTSCPPDDSSSKPAPAAKAVDGATTNSAQEGDEVKKAFQRLGKKSGSRVPRRTGTATLPERGGGKRDVEKEKHVLPSVPGLGYLSERDPRARDTSLSSFFSLHRPLSLTSTIPPSTTTEHFNSLFQQHNQHSSTDQWAAGNSAQGRPEDVIYSLHSAIESLESSANVVASTQEDSHGVRWEVLQESPSNAENQHNGNNGPRHLDGQPMKAKTLEEVVATMRPYHAPPPPQSFVEAASSKIVPVARTRKTAGAVDGKVKTKTYQTTITVHETTAKDGRKSYSAESSPIISVREPRTQTNPALTTSSRSSKATGGVWATAAVPYRPAQPFRHRMLRRGRMYLQSRPAAIGDGSVDKTRFIKRAPSGRRVTMWAISVKRQRKLKMKKHKYKKLMKRTRNLRRRLDRN